MKAEDTVTIDLRGKSSIADYMVVTTGTSNRHVGSIADRVLEASSEAGMHGVRVEGMPHCDWVLIDAGDVHRSCLPAGGPRLLQSRKDVDGARDRKAPAPTERSAAGPKPCVLSSPRSAGSRPAPSANSPSATASAPPKPAAAVGIRDIEIVEMRESRAQDAGRRMLEESIALANLAPEGGVTVVLSERGDNLDSATLSRQIATGATPAGRPSCS